MKIALVISLCIGVFLISVFFGISQQQSDVENLGWVHGSCIAIKNKTLKPGDSFTLFVLDETTFIDSKIIDKPASAISGCFALMEERRGMNENAGYSFYSIKPGVNNNFAIGFMNFEAQSKGFLSFSSCSTSEGIKFSVHDMHLKIWQGYYSLGYDITATCEE